MDVVVNERVEVLLGARAPPKASATALFWENKAGRRTVREQSALSVGDTAFCRADTTAAVDDFALGPDLARL